jgi:hypothetical protein
MARTGRGTAMTNDLLTTLTSISNSLATLGLQVRNEGVAGLGSRSKVAEQIYLPVLRRVYGAPGLANANTLAANSPGIDLFDPASGLGVQVTSEASATKITDTIATVVKAGLPVKRLVVALVVEAQPQYRSQTLTDWRTAAQGHFTFEPDADVLAFDRLLARIQLLPYAEIAAIDADLQALVRGVAAVQLLPHLRQQVKDQLAEEKRIARYIPDVFVETRDTKYQARCFAYPTLFVHRIADWFEREPFADLNRFAVMSGLPAVEVPNIDALAAADTLERAVCAARATMLDIQAIDEELVAYSEVTEARGAKVPRAASRAYVLEEARYPIEVEAGHLTRELADRRTELRCASSRIFLLTGPAGQGKTNFLCDLAERFLLPRGIPCGYVTARQLSRVPEADLGEAVRRLIFPPTVSNLDDGMTALAAACAERQQPFILVIDGLNEHPKAREFAAQLEHTLGELTRYSHVRVLMTCRSEFLEERFGALLSGPLEPVLHVSPAHGQRLGDEEHRELVARYFRFFRVRPRRVARHVTDLLRQDVLLLRFFCEAYGARGRDRGYVQPRVEDVYHQEIFEGYLEHKFGRASQAVDGQAGLRPLFRPAEVRRVLSLVAGHMLESGQFADVPRSVIPAELHAELDAVLDEDIVLRKDLEPRASLLDEPVEILNFTFDEMRDFLLAQHLLSVHRRDPHEFERLVALQPDTAQSIEGLQRFLFYASRAPTNEAFFEAYRERPWYAAVYDTAVFALPPGQLGVEDDRMAEAALRAGGTRAQAFCRQVAVRWRPSHFPFLNLELLLRVARDAGQAFYDDVMVPAFGSSSYGQRSLGQDFCAFVHKEVLPRFHPGSDHEADGLFRLLLLLLPLDADPTLDSPAMTAFGELLLAHPLHALGLLHEAIADGCRWHRPYLWRLLSEAAPIGGSPEWCVVAAESDANDDSDVVLSREAGRFLARISDPSKP